MTPTIYYCYDAYCGWCYGFSPVITKIAREYSGQVAFEVLSGGMIPGEKPAPIGVMAGYIQKAYKTVEERTGVRFGQDFLWHIFNPEKSDWYPDSTKPAIALCVFKVYFPDQAVFFAADLQYALNYEGRDLCDDEAYRHLLDKYGIPESEFYHRLHTEEYRERAFYEFALVKQLKVRGFPAVLMQVSESRFYVLSPGYTDYQGLNEAIIKTLAGISSGSAL